MLFSLYVSGWESSVTYSNFFTCYSKSNSSLILSTFYSYCFLLFFLFESTFFYTAYITRYTSSTVFYVYSTVSKTFLVVAFIFYPTKSDFPFLEPCFLPPFLSAYTSDSSCSCFIFFCLSVRDFRGFFEAGFDSLAFLADEEDFLLFELPS